MVFLAGCAAIAELGGANRGERTMLDALWPAAESFQAAVIAGSDLVEALRVCASAAVEGARKTADLPPRRGRSSYLGERTRGHPDPGAVAVAVWLAALIPTGSLRTGEGQSGHRMD